MSKEREGVIPAFDAESYLDEVRGGGDVDKAREDLCSFIGLMIFENRFEEAIGMIGGGVTLSNGAEVVIDVRMVAEGIAVRGGLGFDLIQSLVREGIALVADEEPVKISIADAVFAYAKAYNLDAIKRLIRDGVVTDEGEIRISVNRALQQVAIANSLMLVEQIITDGVVVADGEEPQRGDIAYAVSGAASAENWELMEHLVVDGIAVHDGPVIRGNIDHAVGVAVGKDNWLLLERLLRDGVGSVAEHSNVKGNINYALISAGRFNNFEIIQRLVRGIPMGEGEPPLRGNINYALGGVIVYGSLELMGRLIWDGVVMADGERVRPDRYSLNTQNLPLRETLKNITRITSGLFSTGAGELEELSVRDRYIIENILGVKADLSEAGPSQLDFREKGEFKAIVKCVSSLMELNDEEISALPRLSLCQTKHLLDNVELNPGKGVVETIKTVASKVESNVARYLAGRGERGGVCL